MNKVNLVGSVSRKDLRSTSSGLLVLDIDLTVSDRRKDGDTWKNVPIDIPLVLFGTRADSVNKAINVGTNISVSGKLSARAWQTRDGEDRAGLDKVVVEEIDVLVSRAEPKPSQQSSGDMYDEDCPF